MEPIEIFGKEDELFMLKYEIRIAKRAIVIFHLLAIILVALIAGFSLVLGAASKYVFPSFFALALVWSFAVYYFNKYKKWAWWLILLLSLFIFATVLYALYEALFILEGSLTEIALYFVLLIISLNPIILLLRSKMKILYSVGK